MAKKLYVGNLNYSTSESALREAFGVHGDVTEVTIIEGKGFGFVEFATEEAAEKAKTALNESDLDGRTIRVDDARPRTNRPSRGGFGGRDSGGGGGGSRRRGW
ncbi:MAG: hypothetical protein B1H03_02670 [Planctomycetales bacterium 4484_113]|mgnify:CR=1 FL=1|nr:MAG: hypothetical protein B1H03_02670 [Planctomycetales bacterium 4484_113]